MDTYLSYKVIDFQPEEEVAQFIIVKQLKLGLSSQQVWLSTVREPRLSFTMEILCLNDSEVKIVRDFFHDEAQARLEPFWFILPFPELKFTVGASQYDTIIEVSPTEAYWLLKDRNSVPLYIPDEDVYYKATCSLDSNGNFKLTLDSGLGEARSADDWISPLHLCRFDHDILETRFGEGDHKIIPLQLFEVPEEVPS